MPCNSVSKAVLRIMTPVMDFVTVCGNSLLLIVAKFFRRPLAGGGGDFL